MTSAHLSQLPLKKILLLGSGALSIGQAGEFDYSGTQAIKAFLEEGIEVVLVNPNIATVQTNPVTGVKVYLCPVHADHVETIIAAERPDGIAAGFGGQTALNCLFELEKRHILTRYNIKNYGTSIVSLKLTEDRELFAERMRRINIPIPKSQACRTVPQCQRAAKEIGYPVIVRAAYALGGLGSGFAEDEEALLQIVKPTLATMPQVLVEKSLQGWKEIEYEIMRDGSENCIAICNMENLDPLGIHTGDSIVVAPSQTLSDREYQLLRDAAIRIADNLQIVGECNVQFALSPDSEQFVVIEVNARLSRSSALASKATGYPIAYIAAKVVLGYSLFSLKNPVTGITFAFFEPALDYLVVKIPRWDFARFPDTDRCLGSTMKSVGEVMAIGKTFPEALQKAARMICEDALGLSAPIYDWKNQDDVDRELRRPTDRRLWAIVAAFQHGMSLETVHLASRIDRWFLTHVFEIMQVAAEIVQQSESNAHIDQASSAFWRRCKQWGFSDQQIALYWLQAGDDNKATQEALQTLEKNIRRIRISHGIVPIVQKIDTTAAEYPSPSNYLYTTYYGFVSEAESHSNACKAIILGGGPYRIGTSVEFDWCAVGCSARLKSLGWQSVMINCNPETVSTDYNASDKLYFEEMTVERILDIAEHECTTNIVATMGGQLPNRLSRRLVEAGLHLLGHSVETIDLAEDRVRFSLLLDKLEVQQPKWVAATNMLDISQFVNEIGFPLLIRPSYVLSGIAMAVVHNELALQEAIMHAESISAEHPIIISEFIQDALEIEFDGIANKGAVIAHAISEHIEYAGVHSGDATLITPPQNMQQSLIEQMRQIANKIALAIHLHGPFNIQFLIKDETIKVIECNARAARTLPFVSKALATNFATIASDVITGHFSLGSSPLIAAPLLVAVKASVFSFRRLKNADPVLGVQMRSTGEAACIGTCLSQTLLLALEASGLTPPKKGVLMITDSDYLCQDRQRIISQFTKMNVPVFHYRPDDNFEAIALNLIQAEDVDLVIDIWTQAESGAIRKLAVQYGCPLLTNMQVALAFVTALANTMQKERAPLLPLARMWNEI